METILNSKKQLFNPDYDLPVYVFDGTYEEYLKLRKESKVFINVNVFLIEPKIIVK